MAGIGKLTDAEYYHLNRLNAMMKSQFLEAITENVATRDLEYLRMMRPECSTLPAGVTWHDGPPIKRSRN
jgi:hypothetical protein